MMSSSGRVRGLVISMMVVWGCGSPASPQAATPRAAARSPSRSARPARSPARPAPVTPTTSTTSSDGSATNASAANGAQQDSASDEPGAVGAVQRGEAAWYGGELHGSATASGERFDKRKLTAAHRTLPMGATIRVTNENNGKAVTVRINDRGPYGKRRRIIDVSEAAARVLDFIDAGRCPVSLEVLTLPAAGDDNRKSKKRSKKAQAR